MSALPAVPPSPFASGDGQWGTGDPFGDGEIGDLRHPEGIAAIAGPAGSGKRVQVRYAMRRHRITAPVLVSLDGRELVDLADAVSAILGMAARLTGHWGRRQDHLSAAWREPLKGSWRAERVDMGWRATPRNRRLSDRIGGPPASLAETMAIWATMAAEQLATVLLVIESADEWIARLTPAEHEALVAWFRADQSPDARLILLGRQPAPMSAVVGEDRVAVVPPPTAEEVIPWLQDRFRAGGWELPDRVAEQLLVSADWQPRTIIRVADHLWRHLRAGHHIIAPADLIGAATAAIREWSPVYEAAWGACTPVQRAVLSLVQQEYGRRLTRHRPAGFPLRPSTIQRAMEALEGRGLIWREEGHGGRARFTDALMSLWLQTRSLGGGL